MFYVPVTLTTIITLTIAVWSASATDHTGMLVVRDNTHHVVELVSMKRLLTVDSSDYIPEHTQIKHCDSMAPMADTTCSHHGHFNTFKCRPLHVAAVRGHVTDR